VIAVLVAMRSTTAQDRRSPATPIPPPNFPTLPALPNQETQQPAPSPVPATRSGTTPGAAAGSGYLTLPPTPPTPRLVVPEGVPRRENRPAPPVLEPLDDSAGPDLREVGNLRDEITLFVGRSKILQVGDDQVVARILVDNPRVADVQLLDADQANPRLLNLYGLSFGRATLTVWDDQDRPATYPIRVIIDEKDLERRIRDTLHGSDVTIRQVAQQVILEGQVPDTKTMSQVLDLVHSELRLTGQANVGSLSGAVGVGGGGVAASGAGQPGGQNVAVNSGPGQSPLSVASTSNAQPGLIVVNRVRVPGPRQIVLKVKIAELNRTAMRQLGVSWLDTRNNAFLGSTIGGAASIGGIGNASQAASFSPAALVPRPLNTPVNSGIISPGFQAANSVFNSAASAAVNGNTQLFGIFNAGEFNLFINALRSNSLAKILAEPNLVALDGQPASFQAGGQFPYPVPQAATAGGGSVITIQFAQFGAILEFLPEIQENDVIRLDVAPTFSELNFGQGFAIPGAGSVPGINQRTARTVVEMREGQTLAIAGLLSTRTTAATTRVPGLGDLPIVGPWFSSNRIETVETELVVLVTPELVAPVEKDQVPPGPGELLLEPNDYEFYFLGRLEGKTGHPHRATVQYLDPLEVMKHFRSEGRWVIGPHGHAD
jgi:pilus assembly protein CpaC